MKKGFFVAAIFLLAASLALASPPQAELLTQRLTELLPRDARWGVTVLDLKSGLEIISSGNTSELLSPASLIKLVTTGAVLDRELDGKHAPETTQRKRAHSA